MLFRTRPVRSGAGGVRREPGACSLAVRQRREPRRVRLKADLPIAAEASVGPLVALANRRSPSRGSPESVRGLARPGPFRRGRCSARARLLFGTRLVALAGRGSPSRGSRRQRSPVSAPECVRARQLGARPVACRSVRGRTRFPVSARRSVRLRQAFSRARYVPFSTPPRLPSPLDARPVRAPDALAEEAYGRRFCRYALARVLRSAPS